MTALIELLRLYRIISVFVAYQLVDVVPKRPLTNPLHKGQRLIFWVRRKHLDKKPGVRLRLALQELGPVWIKFGQMLSTRRDLFPAAIADQLAKLQDQVEPFDGKLARSIIETSLEGSIEEWFDDFDENALASASIAQVHTATLKSDKTQVVIKVIRPNIEKQIYADLRLMYRSADLLVRFYQDSRRFRPKEVVTEYEKTLLKELDLCHEAANAIQLRRNFIKSNMLYVPKTYTEFICNNVMVSERIYGIPVSDIKALKENGINMQVLAERGLQVFFTQVFRDSFFHADMHPGNIFVSYEHPHDPQYIAVDCGIVGTLNQEDKRYLAENFLAFFNRNYRKVAELQVDSGWVKGEIDIDELEVAIRTVCEPIVNKPLAEVSYGLLLMNLFNTARKFNMEVQPQLILLEKTLIYVEGLGRQLYPQLNLWKTAKPFLESWMKRQVGVRAVARRIKEKAPYWVEKLPDVPDMVYQGMNQQKALRQSVDELRQTMQVQRKLQSRVFYLLGISAILLLGAVILYVNHHRMEAMIPAITGFVIWLYGWIKVK